MIWRAGPPTLSAASVLWLRREVSVVHFPGLARPRHIDCGRCSEAQRDELHRLLAILEEEVPPLDADGRLVCLSVEDDDGTVVWRREIAEEQAPPALWRWWRLAEVEEDEE